MKICNKCNNQKDYCEFTTHPSIPDGYYNQCKQCRFNDRKVRELKQFNPDFSGEKVCKRCDLSKLKSDFITNKSSKDGFNGWCKACSKDSIISKKYNINLKEYNLLLKKQEYKCAICKTITPGGPSNEFVVDHCHLTEKVRGLLCNHCNTGLGKLGDTIESLERAINYLKSNSDKIEDIGENCVSKE